MRLFASMRLFVAVGVLAFAAGCSSLNPFASSGPKMAELTDFKPTVEMTTLWQQRVGDAGPYVFQPAIAGDSVYAAAHDGSVVRIDGGRSVWRTGVGGKLSAGVGSDGRLVVVVSAAGEAIALEATSGAERWRAQLGAEVLAAPAVNETVVVVRASDNRLIGLDAQSGSRKWVYQRATPPLALRSFAGLYLESGVALLGYPGGKLVAVNADNGGMMWELTVATPRGATELERVADVAGTPVVSRREVCAVAYQGRAACFDLGNGNALWARDLSSSVGMDRDTRFVVVTDDADAVHALDAFSGASAWKQAALARRAVSRPLIVGDLVAVGDAEGYVHLLQRESGAFAARARADGGAIVADPQRLGQGFVVQTRGGTVAAYEAR